MALIQDKMSDTTPVAFILCYTIKTSVIQPDHNQEVFTDQWHIFADFDEKGNTPEQQAENKLNEIEKSLDNHSEIYTWNIAILVNTSDHYSIATKRPEKVFILAGESAVRKYENDGVSALKGDGCLLEIDCGHDKSIEQIIDQTLNELHGWYDYIVVPADIALQIQDIHENY